MNQQNLFDADQPVTLRQFAEAVSEMRNAQRECFRNMNKANLMRNEELTRQVDRLLTAIVRQGA